MSGSLIHQQYKLKDGVCYYITTDLLGKDVPSNLFFSNPAPRRITNKESQNECINGPKFFPIFKRVDYFIAIGHNKDRKTTSLLSRRGQAVHMAAHKQDTRQRRMHTTGQSVSRWRDHSSMADPYSHSQERAVTADLRHNEWCLPTHASSRWEEAAAGGRSLPPGNNLSHPKLRGTHPISSHGMGGRIFSMHS